MSATKEGFREVLEMLGDALERVTIDKKSHLRERLERKWGEICSIEPTNT